MGKSGPRLRGSGRKQQVLLSLLRKVREDGGLRQEDVARVFGWDKTFVSKYETGVRRLDLLELDELCKVCGISLVDFVKRYRRALEKKVPRQEP
jgi:transcriptional regulator with XRE-family HTH domain